MKGTRLYRKVEVYYLPWTLLFYFWFPKHNFIVNTLQIQVSTDQISHYTGTKFGTWKIKGWKIQCVHTAPYNNIGSRYGGTLKQQKNYNCTIAAICIHLTKEEFHLRQDEVTKPSCTINIVRVYCSNQDLKGKKHIGLMAWRLNTNSSLQKNGCKMIIDA